LVSTMDPVYFFSELDSDSPTDSPQTTSGFRERWTAVMSSFKRVSFEDPDKARFEEIMRHRHDLKVGPLLQWIRKECDHTRFLRKVGLDLFSRHSNVIDFSAPALRNELVGITGSYYSMLWASLNSSERLVLFQLANDGWSNNKNEQAMRQL